MSDVRQRIVVVGGGGHGLVVIDALRCIADAGHPLEVVAVVDDAAALQHQTIGGVEIVGPIAALSSIPHDATVVAIGNNGVRRRIQESLMERGEVVQPVCHPAAIIARDAVVAAGAVIAAGAVVGPLTRIGTGAIVNTGARVDHHCAIGAYAHIAPGVTLGGSVTVGPETLVGIGASVLPGVCVGGRAIVGAGAVVLKDVGEHMTVAGVPARPIVSGRRFSR